MIIMKVELEDLKLNNEDKVFGIMCNVLYESTSVTMDSTKAPFVGNEGVTS